MHVSATQNSLKKIKPHNQKRAKPKKKELNLKAAYFVLVAAYERTLRSQKTTDNTGSSVKE